jgi:Glycosyltransferase Family 4
VRVALFTDGISPYVIGGMQKHSFYLAKFFAKNKVHVLLYHTSPVKLNEDLDCFTSEETPYISTVWIPFERTDNLFGHYIRESFEYSKKIYNHFTETKQKVDFVYAQGFCAWYFILQKSKNNLLPPVGVNFHGLEMFQKSANVKMTISTYLFRRPVKQNLRNADVVFSLGGKLTNIISNLGIQKNKIIEIPIGIDTDWLNT